MDLLFTLIHCSLIVFEFLFFSVYSSFFVLTTFKTLLKTMFLQSDSSELAERFSSGLQFSVSQFSHSVLKYC